MKKSFTLIELLIVLVIIGVLVTLAMPQYQSLVIRARGAEAMNNLRSVSDSLLRYYIETGNFPGFYGVHPNDIGLDVTLGPSKYFNYSYVCWLGGRFPHMGITDAYCVNWENAPAGTIVAYGIFFSIYSYITNENGQGVQGEKVAENRYRYYRHYTKNAGWGMYEKLGWP